MHIVEYLHYFVSTQLPPSQAVLIEGPWGCGKTHFIKAQMEAWEEEKIVDNGVLYVSMFGVDDVSQVASQLFSQLHPTLASPAGRFTGMVFKGLLRGALKIDLTDNVSGSMNADAGGAAKEAISWLGSVSGRVIVFDDLERSKLGSQELWGYINGLVEHSDCRVILVANEEKLADQPLNELPSSSPSHREIKEKIVGRQFRIEPNSSLALRTFLEDAGDFAEKFLQPRQKLILEVHSRGGAQNLRHLRSFVEDVQWLLSTLPPELCHKLLKAKEDTIIDQFSRDFIHEFIAYHHTFRAGVPLADLPHLHGRVQARIMAKIAPQTSTEIGQTHQHDEESHIKKDPADIFFQFFGFDSMWYSPQAIPGALWKRILEGRPDLDAIDKHLDEYIASRQKPEPWQKLGQWWRLTDEEYEAAWNDIRPTLDNLTETRLNVLLNIFHIQSTLASSNLWDEDVPTVIKNAKDHLRTLQQTDKLEIQQEWVEASWQISDSFESSTVPDFKDVISVAQQIAEEQRRTIQKNDILDDFTDHMDDSDWLHENVVRTGNAGYPIFAYTVIDETLKAFETLKRPVQRLKVAQAFVERYRACTHSSTTLASLIDERPLLDAFLRSLVALQDTGKAPSRHAHTLAVGCLKEAIALLDDAMMQDASTKVNESS